MKKLILGLSIVIAMVTLTGCNPFANEAETVSHNISKNADSFESMRRVVFINNVTGEYLLEITGNCSIEVDSTDSHLELICKIGKNSYQKHYLGLNETTTYVVEEIGFSEADPFHYEIIFRPEQIIPDVNLQTSSDDE